MKTKENVVIICLFYPSLEQYGTVFTAKKAKTVMPSRRLQAKGEMCTLQTGKLCCNAININKVLVPVYVQKLQDNSISHLSWALVKEFAVFSYLLSYAQL